jgi:hypothetical protein
LNDPILSKTKDKIKELENEILVLKKNYEELAKILPNLKLPPNILFLGDKIIELKDSKEFKKTENLKISKSTMEIFNLFLEVNVNNHIKLSDANYNLSSNDILQKNITSKLAGYTGTLYIKDILNVKKQLENTKSNTPIFINKLIPVNSVDGEIYSSLIGKKINEGISYFYTKNYDSIDSRTTNILDEISKKDYRALIDVGSLFYNDTNDMIAQKWKNKLKEIPEKNGYVLFLDNKNDKYVYNIRTDVPYERFDPIKHKKEDLYIYFDQSHITGIDIKLKTNTKIILRKHHGYRCFSKYSHSPKYHRVCFSHFCWLSSSLERHSCIAYPTNGSD